MMYEEDFSYFLRSRGKAASMKERNKIEAKKIQRRRNMKIAVIDLGQDFQAAQKAPKAPTLKKESPKKSGCRQMASRKSLKMLFLDYCENTSLHGFKYFMQKGVSWWEKLLWFIVVLGAFLGISYISFMLQQRFSSAPLATVVESTVYPVANIPYPAVTICNFNRINWERVDAAMERYLPHASDVARKQFVEFLLELNKLEYGSFDEFIGIQEWNYEEMLHVDLLELYKEVAYTCEELFHEAVCWWRNRYVNCCEIFVTQVTEYGLCQTFNSVLNDDGYEKFKTLQNYPRRTAQFADWSGLRVDLKIPANGTATKGLIVAVTHPFQWVSNGYVIPAGSNTGIMVRPTYSYATESVLGLEVNDRKCIFPGETVVYGEPVMKLPLKTDVYMTNNCFAECRQRHMIKYCNCTIGFFFETGNYTQCTMAGVRCLNKYDTIMNYMKPPKGNPFFNDDEEGISCECWQECTRVEYEIQISPNMVDDVSPDMVTLDVHYQKSTIVIFRTDLLYGWMDLLVGFGGIFGLFCGASLISGVEFLFYVIVGIFVALK